MTRFVSGVALAASAFALVWFLSSTALLAVALAVAGLAFLEFARLARAVGAPLPFLPALAATLAACAAVALPWVHVPSLLGVILVALGVSLMTSGLHGAPLVHGAGAGLLAPVYIGLPLGALVAIHQVTGREGVLTLVATVAASDTCQYYSGRTFGRRPLAPTISPKKTVEGAIGGLVLAPLALLAIAHWWLPALHPGAVWVAGLGMVIAGIAGDLFESSFKRAAGVKDSGTLIPGHGGVLDRIDALLFCAPLFYLLVTLA
ncbi:MAG: phosphatidate cytidylyltransferase [Acidobacteria bacterium]|nr:phosphatidate cytidylyltransferase [Acidobacteriota bacterium]